LWEGLLEIRFTVAYMMGIWLSEDEYVYVWRRTIKELEDVKRIEQEMMRRRK